MAVTTVVLLVLLNISFNMAYDYKTKLDTLFKILREDLKKAEKLTRNPSSSGQDKYQQQLNAIKLEAFPTLNDAINMLTFEIHFPGYRFCGPGTSEKRLESGERGINQLDAACREHDIAYINKDGSIRAVADEKLSKRAYEIYESTKFDRTQRRFAYIAYFIMAAKYKAFNYFRNSH